MGQRKAVSVTLHTVASTKASKNERSNGTAAPCMEKKGGAPCKTQILPNGKVN